MKKWLLFSLLALVGACGGAQAAGTDPGATDASAATPLPSAQLTQLEPHAMAVVVDGKRYAGDWTSAQCFTDPCRGVFRNVPRIYRRHVHHGEAELTAKDGARLACDWVSYRDHVQGTCTTADGTKLPLQYSVQK